MHGVLLLPSLKIQRELIQGPITQNYNNKQVNSPLRCDMTTAEVEHGDIVS